MCLFVCCFVLGLLLCSCMCCVFVVCLLCLLLMSHFSDFGVALIYVAFHLFALSVSLLFSVLYFGCVIVCVSLCLCASLLVS